MCVVSHLVFIASLPLAKHSTTVKPAARSTTYKAKTSPPPPLPITAAGSLRGRRGWQVVLLVLPPGQPVGGLSSSSLERKERCVPWRPRQSALAHRSDKYVCNRHFTSEFLISAHILGQHLFLI